jgi:hypothetical protein
MADDWFTVSVKLCVAVVPTPFCALNVIGYVPPVPAPGVPERLQQEAAVLKQNPMLIQKIIAERLSDKLQIIMVPTNGNNFFASDVLRSAFAGGMPTNDSEDTERDSPTQSRKQAQAARIK